MIDIGNNNLDNELNLKKNKYIIGIDPYDNNSKSKAIIFKNGELIDLRTEEDIEIENYNMKLLKFRRSNNFVKYINLIYTAMIEEKSNNKNNPKELEYWRNIFPTKTDSELEEYRVKWSKENPKYLKFKNL